MSRVDTWETVAAVSIHRANTMSAIAGNGVMFSDRNGYDIALRLSRLAKVARTLHRLYERNCNEPTELCYACAGQFSKSFSFATHRPSTCFNAKMQAWEKRAEAIGAELGVLVTTQRDPRGAAVKMWADHEDGRMLGCF